jgi:hypothetical protein
LHEVPSDAIEKKSLLQPVASYLSNWFDREISARHDPAEIGGCLMLWRVDGADRSTGDECTVIIEADNGPEMEAKAAEMDILVSKGREATAEEIDELLPKESREDVLEYARPRKVLPTPSKPGYQSTVAAANWAKGLGMCLLVLGWIFLVIAALSLIAIIGGSPVSPSFFEDAFGSGLICLIGGGVLRVVGFIGIAVADIARNSMR